MDRLNSRLYCTGGVKSKTGVVDAQISSPCSDIKLPALYNLGIFVGENKCFDQGTVLLHGGEDEAGYPVCTPMGTPGAIETAPWLPGVNIRLPGRVLLL